MSKTLAVVGTLFAAGTLVVPTASQAMALAGRAVMVMDTKAQRPSVVAKAALAPFKRRRRLVRRDFSSNTGVAGGSRRSGLKAAPLFFANGADPKSPDFYPRFFSPHTCPPLSPGGRPGAYNRHSAGPVNPKAM